MTVLIFMFNFGRVGSRFRFGFFSNGFFSHDFKDLYDKDINIFNSIFHRPSIWAAGCRAGRKDDLTEHHSIICFHILVLQWMKNFLLLNKKE